MTGTLRARPVPATHDRPFWDGLREHRLMLPRCDRCELFAYPPAPRCRRCLRPTRTWRQCAGTGTLHAWATARRPFAPGFTAPYTVAQVALDVQDGLLIDALLLPADKDTPRIGSPVTAVHLDDRRGFSVLAFRCVRRTPRPPTD
ncbi:Zn-ribbon domain-containing OB-fold protein [Streptomyces sp. NPDC088747]|uniref:Zn-ribbon domain-containing OB-fold protein n=1 Tax=Streptomyces sp. NPDC088747 TaxID=3365886 RepID=UPI0038264E74